MAEPFVAEIRITAFGFPPRGWAFCNGQILAISQNQALFALLGTTYGGDGRTTFGLPNLQGRTPIHAGTSYFGTHAEGQSGGEAAHALNSSEIPNHTHTMQASTTTGNVGTSLGNVLARSANALYEPRGTNLTTMSPSLVATAGGSLAHNNMQPYLVLNFIIALQGIFPPRN